MGKKSCRLIRATYGLLIQVPQHEKFILYLLVPAFMNPVYLFLFSYPMLGEQWYWSYLKVYSPSIGMKKQVFFIMNLAIGRITYPSSAYLILCFVLEQKE